MLGDGMVGDVSDLVRRHAKIGLGSIGPQVSTIDNLRSQNAAQAAMMGGMMPGLGNPESLGTDQQFEFT